MRTYPILTLLAPIALLTACSKDEPEAPQDLGLGYYPVSVGHWVEYQVDSLWRDDNQNILDSVSYRLMVRVNETYTDPTGRTAYRILRSVEDELGEWVVRDVWSANRSNTAAEMVEENLRRLKISFPVREGRTWNMNVFNTEPEFEVALRDVDEPWQGDSLAFDSTAVVRNTVPPNLVVTRNFEERYARNVGLVSKYWEETNTQTTYPPNQPPVVRVVGWRLNMEAVAYGHD